MKDSIRAAASVTVERGIEDVFDRVADLTTMDDWVDGVSRTRLVSGTGGSVGDEYEAEYAFGGRTGPMRMRIVAMERPTALEVASVEGPFPFRNELRFAAADGRTRVRSVLESGADGRFTAAVFTVFEPVLRALMARRLRAELAELKRVLESDSGSERGSPAGSEPGADSESTASA